MAEEIRRRVAALRLAALLAVAVTLAGLTSRDAAPRPVSGSSVPADSVGSRQVVDGSLKGEDLRPGVALSPARAADRYLKISAAADTYLSKIQAAEEFLYKEEAATLYLKMGDAEASYLKLEDAAATYLGLQDAADTYLKLDAATDFLHKVDAAELYIKMDDAAATYLKLEDAATSYLKLEDAANLLSKTEAAETYLDKVSAAETYLDKVTAANIYIKQGTEIDAHKLGGIPAGGFVQGAGSVESGLAVLGLDGQAGLLDLPGLVGVTVVAQGKEGSLAKLVNTSPGPLLVSYGGTSVMLEPKGAHEILIGLNQPALVQLVATEKGGMATLTLTASELGDNQLAFTGQALVGMP